MQSHFKKMELFTESVDQRLSNLESAIRDNSKSKVAASLYPKDSNRDKSPAYKYKTSPKAKKKKKTRLISAYETGSHTTLCVCVCVCVFVCCPH